MANNRINQINRIGGITNLDQYRGLGHSVANMSVTEALATAQMDWKTIPMPMEIVGKNERRPSAYKSLVRSDNGAELGVATADYKPFHNEQIVSSMFQAAHSVDGMELERLGCLDGGRRVWGMATIPNQNFELPVGIVGRGAQHNVTKTDRTVLKALFGSGHVPGMAFTIKLIAERVVCVNGAELDVMLGKFTMVHSGTFGPTQINRIRSMFDGSGIAFKKYADSARYLREASVGTDENRVFVAQLLGPQLLDKMVKEGMIGERVRLGWGENDKNKGDGFNGFHTGRLLDAIVGQNMNQRVVEDQLLNRPGQRVMELIETQPGHDMAEGTMWNTYNAVTYFVDHERGRTADSGLNAAFFGEGAQLKKEAMELATQYAGVLQAGGAR